MTDIPYPRQEDYSPYGYGPETTRAFKAWRTHTAPPNERTDRMPDYTPTTTEVREAYQFSEGGLDFKRIYNQRGEQFDRWLDQHDTEVAAEAVYLALRPLRNVTGITLSIEEGDVFCHYDAYADGIEIHFQDDNRTMHILPRRKA